MDVKTMAVVGAGNAGRTIACAAVRAGYRTILEDISRASLDEGIAEIRQTLGHDVARRKIDPRACALALRQLTTANSPQAAAREADLIIETVPDDMEIKIELFTIFDKFAKPGAIFATTTSSLSISEIAEATFCPERCIGMRFMSPRRESKLLELVRGRETSEQTIASCREVGRRMSREVALVPESAGSVPGREISDYNQRKVVGTEG